MINLYKNSVLILIAFSVFFLLYSCYIISKSKNTGLQSLPFPYNRIYNNLRDFSLIEEIINYLEKGFYLIYVDKIKAKIMSVMLICVFPCVFVILVSVMGNFTQMWYFKMVNIFVCTVTPLYMIKNFTSTNCLKIRRDLLTKYTSICSLLSSNRMDVVIDEIIYSSNGSIKLIFMKFKELYPTDKIKAYNFLLNITGDQYSNTVVKALMRYEDQGIDPSSEVNRICVHANEMYALEMASNMSYKNIKIMSLMMFVFNIAIGAFGKVLSYNMSTQYSPTSLYVSLLICLICFTLSFVFESN